MGRRDAVLHASFGQFYQTNPFFAGKWTECSPVLERLQGAKRCSERHGGGQSETTGR
jgi:hypothetical protein